MGTVINTLLIILGSLCGLVLRKSVPSHWQETIMQGLGLVVMVIGIQMALKTNNVIIVIISVSLGAALGEFLKIDYYLNRLGELLASSVQKFTKNMNLSVDNLAEGFITTTLIYCVGAMSVIGSIQDGLTGDATILYTKGVIDGITAIFFTASLGVGVVFSAISVFLYQGIITLSASFFSGILSDEMLVEMTATGGIVIIGIGITMLKIKEIKIASLLPSVFLAIFIVFLYTNIKG